MTYHPVMNIHRVGRTLAAALALLTLAACSKNELEGRMEITFRVTAPGVATDDTVFVAGNIPELGNWDASGTQMARVDGDTWEVMVPVHYGARVEYKFTLGDWSSEAVNDDGSPMDNFKVVATRSHTVHHTIEHWKSEGKPPAGITGTATYHLNVAGEGIAPRNIVVWLPPGYNDNNDRYPVLYLEDGQNVFNPATSFLGIDWGLDETATRLIGDGKMKPVIMVGIYNSPNRSDDYGIGDTGKAYRKFVVDVVKPLIDSSYRTLTDKSNNAVMGSSLGGLVSFLLAWDYPDVFQQAACLSPAFFPEAVDLVRSAESIPAGMRIYMDNGTVGLEAELQPMCDNMMQALAAKGYTKDSADFDWFLDEGAEHNEAAWAKRAERPLLFLFGTGTP